MSHSPQITSANETKTGLISGFTAYMIWGLFPIYFVAVKNVPTLEILGHRIIWSIPFGFLILIFRKQLAETLSILRSPKTVALLAFAALALAVNWGVYIWAVQQDQIFQGSLGYYINPLIYVLVGVAFFKETISRLQIFAVFLAFVGVTILTIQGGVFPWISLILAASFTTYGIMRKQIAVGAMPGLFVETLTLVVPALMLFAYVANTSSLTWGNTGWEINALLVFAGPLTVLPLVAFALAARRISLSALGILQYVGPTLQFACAVYFGEAFTTAHAWCFGFIWAGVIVFAFDAIRRSRS